MNTKLKAILDSIETNGSMLFTESAFHYFISNQISEEELIEILKVKDIELPGEFSSLPIKEKKLYFNHKSTHIYFENGQEMFYQEEYFNPHYFYDLAGHARKNKALTGRLVEYLRSFGNNYVNLMFHGMQYVKLENINLIRYQPISNYAKENSINDLYDLLTSLFSESEIKKDGVGEMKKLVADWLKKETNFNFDFGLPFVNFALHMECLLHLLPRKEANTIKLKFKILEKEQLREIDYYSDEDRQSRILNTFKKKANSNMLLSKLFSIVTDQNQKGGFSPNGYSAIYDDLIEEGL